MKDKLINLTIDNFFRNPLHWGTLKFKGQTRKRFGIVYYKTRDVFSPTKADVTIWFFFFWTWEYKLIFKEPF